MVWLLNWYYMRQIFVEQAIIIDAHISEVWKVLTEPALTKQWIHTWWPELDELQSDWKQDSPVVWKLQDGSTGADGKVHEVQAPNHLVYNFRINEPNTSKQEIITYKLEERDNHTYLLITAGDYGDTPEHEQCFPGAQEGWEKSISKIKELAEK